VKPWASIVAFRAASGAAAGEQLERAAAVCLLKTSSAAEILVITDPNANRNKIEISTLYSDEKIPCSLPKIPCSLQKISLLVPPGDPILSRPGFISLHGPSESRTSGTTKP
jgi:hypothetical protein